MSPRLVLIPIALAGLLAAQDPPARAGRISYVSGNVSFEPAGVNDWAAAAVNRPLTMGDQLFADNGGRAEVHVPGTAFRLGDQTAFEFMNLDDRTVQVRLSEGELDVRVRRLEGSVEIDTPNLAFTVSRAGEYRLNVNSNSGETDVIVRDGNGQITTGAGTIPAQVGQMIVVTGQGTAAQYTVNAPPSYDAFDKWVVSRNSRDDRYATSQYVSPDVVGYQDLGEYGTWRSTPDYGEVWVPNGIATGWAPYQDGQWAWIDPWGWTWVDDEPWGFAPFHYGRWAYLNGYWGWCPGPVGVDAVYAPALVAWVGFGAGFGVSIGSGPAVGWFPLGPRDVYIPAFGASAAFVSRVNLTNARAINAANVTGAYNNYERTKSIPVNTYMNRSVPGAVMAVPQNAMADARPVKQAAIKVQPNQIAGVKSGLAAPPVAPHVGAVLGAQPGRNVARPPAAVTTRPVVARTRPPAPPVAFQQRAAQLAKNPGHPLPVSQLRGTPGASASVRPQVNIISAAHPAPPPRATAAAHAPASPSARQPATPSASSRPFEPPNARQPAPQSAHSSAPARPYSPPAPVQPSTRPTAQQTPRSANVRPPKNVAAPQPHTAAPSPQPTHQAPPPRQQTHATPPQPAHQAAPPRQQAHAAPPPRPAPAAHSAPHAAPPPRPQPEHAPPPEHKPPEHH